MHVIPAIDLMDGECVRLVQGEYHRKIAYHRDPIVQAEEFFACGALWLHVVDLDGAKVGKPVNLETLKNITGMNRLKVQTGGGIRNEETIAKILSAGAERVILGTAAINDPQWFRKMAETFPGKIALGLDARRGRLSTHAWTRENPNDLIAFAREAAALPIAAIIYTDITRDGMMAGPDVEITRTLAEAVEIPVIASGGVSTLDNVRKLAELKIEGAIVGRALYEGTLNLQEAIEAAREKGK